MMFGADNVVFYTAWILLELMGIYNLLAWYFVCTFFEKFAMEMSGQYVVSPLQW